MFWISAVVVLVLAYWHYWRWKNRQLLRLAALVPGPTALPIIGNALFFMVSPSEQLTKIAQLIEKYGDYLRFWLGPDLIIVVKNPADIRHLLTSNKVNLKGPAYEFMKTYIGPGILTGGPTWRNQRKLATPSYNKKSVHEYAPIFNKEANNLVRKLRLRRVGTPFNIYEDVVQTTTQCVCQTLLGLSKKDSLGLYRLQDIINITPRMYDLVFQKMTRWWMQIPFIFWILGGKKREMRLMKLIDHFISDVIDKGRKVLDDDKTVNDETLGVIGRYLLSKELSAKEIKWDVFTIFTTSQEASAKITSGLLLFLAHLPEWQERVYKEIIEVLGPEDRDVTDEDLKHLQYLDMVYKETLRYLSIAALIQRTVEEEVSIRNGEVTLPKGTTVVIPIHELHRDPLHWKDPSRLDPERFLPENVKMRDPNAFIPFSLGAMDCLGRVYATGLIKTLAVRVLRHFELAAVGSQEDIQLHVAISVEVAGGYRVIAKPRLAQTKSDAFKI